MPGAGQGSWPVVVRAMVDAALLAMGIVLALTGAALLFSYAPTPERAWASVYYTSYIAGGGATVRALHALASHAILLLTGARLLVGAVAVRWDHKEERVAHVVSLALVGLSVAVAITGHLLPWDQAGWSARKVEFQLVSLLPLVGETLAKGARGGDELGALGLTRMFATHLVVGSLVAFIVVKNGTRSLAEERLRRGAFVVAGALFALVTCAVTFGAPPLRAPMVPGAEFAARPEWFVEPLFRVRKFFSGAGEIVGPGAVIAIIIGYLLIVPMLAARFAVKRRVLLVPWGLAVAALSALVINGRRVESLDRQLQREGTLAANLDARALTLASRGIPGEGPVAMLRSDALVRGRELYARYCSSCHVLGDLGDATKATAPRLDGWGSAAWIEHTLREPDASDRFGRGPYVGKMPAVDKNVPDAPAGSDSRVVKNADEMRAIVSFLVKQGEEPGEPSNATDAKAVAEGERLVVARCTTCHTVRGKGDDEGSHLAPELAGYASLAWTRLLIAEPSSDLTYRALSIDPAKGHMPRFDGEMAPRDIALLAKYVRSVGRGLSLE
jgi:ubiquinol-cytochrome c reductase cytochrome b subunit